MGLGSRNDSDSLAHLARDVRDAVLSSPGDLDRETRRVAFDGGPVPEPLAVYTEKVRVHAYKVLDRDVDAMREAGLSEEAIFELTVALAVGEGWRRLDAALLLLDRAGDATEEGQ